MTDIPNLSLEERNRYSRQLSLPEIGESGQIKLKNGKVLIVGAGGLGSPIALYLAAAGIGHIGLVDGDNVNTSNLQRQIIHFTDDLNRPKVLSAQEKLMRLNPNIEVTPHHEMLSDKNASKIISLYDFIIDATDSLSAKFLINDVCVSEDKAFSYGGINGFQGATMTHIKGSACLRCLFENLPDEEPIIGPIGAIAGIIGSIQALEAIKFITDTGNLLTNSLLTVDSLTMELNRFGISKRTNCTSCHDK